MKRYQSFLVPAIFGSLVCALILTYLNPLNQRFTLHTRYLEQGGDEVVFGAWDYDDDGTSEIVNLGFDVFQKQYIKSRQLNTLETNWQCGINGTIKPLIFNYITFFKYPGDTFYSTAFLNHHKDKISMATFLTMEHNLYGELILVDSPEVINNMQCGFFETVYFDNDTSPNIIFGLDASWSYQPRNIYRYDPVEDTLYKTPTSGGKKKKPLFIDINGDGQSELVTVSNASCNYEPYVEEHQNIPYPDTCSWIMIYNQDLTYFVDPVMIPGRCASASNIYSSQTNTIYLISHFQDPDTTYYYSYSLDSLELKATDPFTDNSSIFTSNFESDENIVLINIGTGNPDIFNIKTQRTRHISGDFKNKKSVNYLKKTEKLPAIHLYYNSIQKMLYGYSSDYKYSTSVSCLLDDLIPPNYEVVSEGEPALLLNTKNHGVIISAQPVTLWKWRYLIWFGIWIASVGFVMAIWMLAQRQTKKRYELKSALDRYKIMAIHNQLNPHFIFNIINTLAGTLYMDDKSKAHNYFGNFSKLLRITINSSDRIERTLADELDFVKNYLELQVLRSNNIISYNIEIGEDISNSRLQTKIPGLLIHTFVENSLKHGFPDPKYPGKIAISIKEITSGLQITISDNGIGRDNAKHNKEAQSTGKGLKLLQEKIDLFNEINKKDVHYTMEDNNPGVRVMIEV
ncbi:MAG: hypothetical protein C0593_14300 [Marinilabiliales bacterium]|nr:MAG: hypothetical protein C0593_14300 [Marinilabiliales bacterium]